MTGYTRNVLTGLSNADLNDILAKRLMRIVDLQSSALYTKALILRIWTMCTSTVRVAHLNACHHLLTHVVYTSAVDKCFHGKGYIYLESYMRCVFTNQYQFRWDGKKRKVSQIRDGKEIWKGIVTMYDEGGIVSEDSVEEGAWDRHQSHTITPHHALSQPVSGSRFLKRKLVAAIAQKTTTVISVRDTSSLHRTNASISRNPQFEKCSFRRDERKLPRATGVGTGLLG